MKRYVLGFMFSADRARVVLLRKTHPPEQRDRLNGVGGEMKANETPLEAMQREFREEAGVVFDAWARYARMTIETPREVLAEVLVFRAFAPDRETVWKAEGTGDERVEVHQTDAITRRDLVDGVPYLIALALNEQVLSAEILIERRP